MVPAELYTKLLASFVNSFSLLKVVAFQVPVSVWILIVVSSFMVTFIQVPELAPFPLLITFLFFWSNLARSSLTRLYLIHSRLDLIRNSAKSHHQLGLIFSTRLIL
jgi:hypothetical protein